MDICGDPGLRQSGWARLVEFGHYKALYKRPDYFICSSTTHQVGGVAQW